MLIPGSRHDGRGIATSTSDHTQPGGVELDST
jgi:hypothetical protein